MSSSLFEQNHKDWMYLTKTLLQIVTITLLIVAKVIIKNFERAKRYYTIIYSNKILIYD